MVIFELFSQVTKYFPKKRPFLKYSPRSQNISREKVLLHSKKKLIYREKLTKIELLVEKYLETLIEKILSEKIYVLKRSLKITHLKRTS